MRSEPALRFWLDYVEAEGGAAEEADDSAVVILPGHLQDQFDLPEDVSVTSDPDVAREDGAFLIIPGQPALTGAAERLLAGGDVGWAHLPWPASPPPDREVLQAAARDRIPVDHGRIDLDGQPGAAYLPAIHVGVLVEYRISLEDRFQEKEQLWVDGRSGRPFEGALAAALDRGMAVPGAGRDHRGVAPGPSAAVARAHAVLEGRAIERRGQLVADTVPAREAELTRVAAYYDAALASIGSRRSTAAPERQTLYDAQAAATVAERARRLQETEEKYAASHEIRPFRLHVVGIPALIVPVVVRRGARTYPLVLDWYLPFATYGPVGCPHCDGSDTLVAGRDRLGCRGCLPRLDPAPASPALEQSPANGSSNGDSAEAAGGPGSPGPVTESAASNEGSVPSDGGRGSSSGAERARPGRRGAAAPGSRVDLDRLADQIKRVPAAGNQLTQAFWVTVSRGERWSRTATVPGSPLEAAYRLYGIEGPLRAVGVPPGLWVSRLSASTPPSSPDDAATAGTLEAGNLDVPFTLRWRLSGGRAVAAEVLPWQAGPGSGWLAAEQLHPAIKSWLTKKVPRPGSLGAVEEALWSHVAKDGLPFVLRSLTLWWRLQGQRRVRELDVAVTAAAVVVVTSRWCGSRTSGRLVAGRHRVPERAVSDACRTLDELLGVGRGNVW